MTRTSAKLCTHVSIAILLVGIGSGCGSRSYAKRLFVLQADRPDQPAEQRHAVVLAVRSFSIDPLCDSRGLMYRKGESEYESDFYNEFLIAPEVVLCSQTRNWLAQSGMVKTVLEPGGLIEPTHVLEGNVLALHGDFRDRNRPEAVMRIRVFLIAYVRSQPEVVFTRDYRVSQQAEAATADALVTALDRCLEQILSALEQDLGKTLRHDGQS